MKRLFDVAFSIVVLVVLFPILVAAALAVKLTSSGPIFYGAKRAGLNGVPIRVWKFRTMVTGADKTATVTIGADSRITGIGKWLRASKLDEIPQLWNVLRSEMSIVGPRPESLDIVENHYSDLGRETLTVRPGLTCPGNLIYYVFHEDLRPPKGVSANDFYVEHLLRPKLLADVYYVRNSGVGFDLRVILETGWIIIAKWLGLDPRWTPKFAEEPPDGWRGDAFK